MAMHTRLVLATCLSLLLACVCDGSTSPDGNFHEDLGVGGIKEDKLLKVLRGSADDPVTSLEILYPLDGATETLPIKLATVVNVRSGGVELYKELYAGMSICFEASNVTLACSRSDEPWMTMPAWKLGHYSVRVYFTATDDNSKPIGERYRQSLPVSFSVVSPSELAAHHAEFVQSRLAKYRAGFDLSLVDWASEQQRERPEEIVKRLEEEYVGLQLDVEYDEELVLLIGVKTAVTSNFALRQAMRETWASKDSLPRGVKVLFVGCRPLSLVEEDPELETSERQEERRRLRGAIELEKMVYGDLLTDELDCDDTYIDLANKVKEFLHVAATEYPSAQFVMLADDDVYVRADKLIGQFKRLGPQTRYYSGQVPSIQYARKDTPNRNTSARYSLSMEQYPLSTLPPMAMGAYFFLSMDCAKFVSKNRQRLRGLNGIDDITIPLWMLTIQVHVQHQGNLGYLRVNPCDESFVAFGDLSPLALREVHSNLQENRSFCHGFERYLWLKSSEDAVKNGLFHLLPLFPNPLHFAFVISNVIKVGLLQITTIISSPTQASVKVSYFPSNETFLAYTRRVCGETRLIFPSIVRAMSCSEIAAQMETGLVHFREQIMESGELLQTNPL